MRLIAKNVRVWCVRLSSLWALPAAILMMISLCGSMAVGFKIKGRSYTVGISKRGLTFSNLFADMDMQFRRTSSPAYVNWSIARDCTEPYEWAFQPFVELGSTGPDPRDHVRETGGFELIRGQFPRGEYRTPTSQVIVLRPCMLLRLPRWFIGLLGLVPWLMCLSFLINRHPRGVPVLANISESSRQQHDH
jgi:hypothetical protein